MDNAEAAAMTVMSAHLDAARNATRPRTESITSNALPYHDQTSNSGSATSLTTTLHAPDSAFLTEGLPQADQTTVTVKEPRIAAYITVRMTGNASHFIAMRSQHPKLGFTSINRENYAPIGPFSHLGEMKSLWSTPNGAKPRPSSSPTSSKRVSTKDLRELIQDLPRELYDEIRALTFAFDFTSEGRCIDRINYKPPMQLQINRDIRQKFIPQYYGSDEEWIVVSRSSDDFQIAEVQPWLDSLSPEAFAAVHRPWSDHRRVGDVTTGLYTYAGKNAVIRAAKWQDVCFMRPGHKNESSCWAWSPGPDEYGRWTTKFMR